MRTLLIILMFSALLMGCSKHVTVLPENSQTIAYWRDARDYQAAGRLELAKQYYQLALASARTPDAQTALEREIVSVNRAMQAMR